LYLLKTDKNTQDLIGIQAGNVTIKDNRFSGQYEQGDGEVSRAMVISGGSNNLLIEGNMIYSLRQPAYITGPITGTVSNNLVHTTRGWVVEGGELTFTGNTWGSGPTANAVDIAILSSVSSSHYTDIPAVIAANNG